MVYLIKQKPKKFIFIKIIIVLLISNISFTEDLLEIADYDYPIRNDTSDKFTVAIFCTNDIHGKFYNESSQNAHTKETFYIGGVEYIGKYISILKEHWGNQFLWFDAGDQFQGGLETKLAEGKDMTDFFGIMGLNASAIGNHEFDYGQDYLKARLLDAKDKNFSYISANLKYLNEEIHFDNVVDYQIFTVGDNGEVKIGVIGLTTVLTPEVTAGNLTGLTFEGYIKTIESLADDLRNNKKCNSVIVLAHVGATCTKGGTEEERLTLKIRKKGQGYTESNCGSSDELVKLLKKLPKGKIDAIIAGHKHEANHHWLYDVPIVSNEKFGKYASVLYLTFDKNDNYKLLTDEIQIENPLPICAKVFRNTKRCNSLGNEEAYIAAGDLVEFSFHGVKMEKESALKEISDKYYAKLEKYQKTIVTQTNSYWAQTRAKEANLGNFYCDFLKQYGKSDLSILNSGAFKGNFRNGNITEADIYNVVPSDNPMVKYYIYGRDVKRMMYQIQSGTYAFYTTSGLRQIVSNNPKKKLLDLKLYDGMYESDIDDDHLYSIVTIDYLVPLNNATPGGDDYRRVLKWMVPQNKTHLGELRDVLIGYLKNMKLLDSSKYYNETNLRLRIVEDTNNNYAEDNDEDEEEDENDNEGLKEIKFLGGY